MTDWNGLANRVLGGGAPSHQDCREILRCTRKRMTELLEAARRVREAFFGRRVRVHILMNAKSGLCSEDCSFCSQSRWAKTPISVYPMRSAQEMLEAARRAFQVGAYRFCMVTATRGPSEKDIDTVCEAVQWIKRELPIGICCSLGALTPAKAERLKAAGVDRFNHNLETSRRYFHEICTTHSFEDRVRTVRICRDAGLEVCSGGIVGMGETEEDLVNLAFTLRELSPDSIPVNFLNPRPGTHLAHRSLVDPWFCLKALCLFRFTNPSSEIRIGGGREVNLRELQPLALGPANALFTNGYLTTEGRKTADDFRMIEEAGFQCERPETSTCTSRTCS